MQKYDSDNGDLYVSNENNVAMYDGINQLCHKSETKWMITVGMQLHDLELDLSQARKNTCETDLKRKW